MEKNRKTVVHIVEALEGGLITFVLSLTKHIPDLNHFIIYVDRTKQKDNLKRRFGDNVQLVEWPHAQRKIHPIKDFKAALSLKKILKNIPYDFIHLHSSKAGFLGRLVGMTLKNKKIIYTPNGAAFARKDIGRLSKTLYVTLERFANVLSGEVVCCSKSEADIYKKYHIKCTYINNGIPIPEEKSLSLQTQPDAPINIVTIGRLTNQKNPAFFNEIADTFKNDKRVEFTWIGDGELKPLMTSPNITITGWLSSNQVFQHLQEAHLYLSTALWEGLPFAVLEAMSMAKPLVLYNCVGNRDLVKPEFNGFLFQEKDQVIQYLRYFIESPEKLVTFGQNSFNKLKEEFNVELMAQQYKAKYLSL
ncbi:MAG TPA: glycosyl transferase family 1 [Microscillaceae bacterium]|nr:glycosyl transferase family 1 [Microscillaceae bacterium]